MDVLQAIILGLIQGLTEFLPVSSSGHLEIGKAVLGIEQLQGKENLAFNVVVHGATVLSTIVVFRKDIWALIMGFFKFQWNQETKYFVKIGISMIPVGIVGVFFKDEVELLFDGDIMLVGSMLWVTAILLGFTYYAPQKEKGVGFSSALVIGLSQAVAVLPGISRSGATIATGLLLGIKKENITRFSFLMVLLPIIGANIKDMSDGIPEDSGVSITVLIAGFVAAFLSGLLACTWMIKIVKKGKLIWFAVYCAIAGTIAFLSSWI